MKKPEIVFVSGNFNILHPGHLRLLRFANELGQKLIVGVFSDEIGGKQVHINQQLRIEGVQANNWVDEAVLIDQSLEHTLTTIKPDIVVKGREYENVFNVEKQILDRFGGKLVFSSGDVAFSSLELIKKALDKSHVLNMESVELFSQRHNFSLENLTDLVNNFSNLNVCVVGDLIVDEYITCDPLGMSREDPSIAVTPIDSQLFVGGAGIVAAHAAGLGANVSFLSVVGDDESSAYACKKLKDYQVHASLYKDQSRHTTLKQRYRAQNKTLLRVNHLTQSSISKNYQDIIFNKFSELLPTIDLLVFSDFNYGCLPQPLLERICDACTDNNVVMIADSQCSSQVGDIGRFKNMHLLTPTEHEARVSIKNQEDGLVVLAEKLRVSSNAQNIILKLGSEGVLLHLSENSDSVYTDRLPALQDSPTDVAGAGDSMLISAGLTLASKGSALQAAAIGSIAAGIQVSRLGNTPLSKAELLSTLQSIN